MSPYLDNLTFSEVTELLSRPRECTNEEGGGRGRGRILENFFPWIFFSPPVYFFFFSFVALEKVGWEEGDDTQRFAGFIVSWKTAVSFRGLTRSFLLLNFARVCVCFRKSWKRILKIFSRPSSFSSLYTILVTFIEEVLQSIREKLFMGWE